MKKLWLAKRRHFIECYWKFLYGLFLTMVFWAGLVFFMFLFGHLPAEGAEYDFSSIPTAPSQEMLDRARKAVTEFQEAATKEEVGDLRQDILNAHSVDAERQDAASSSRVGAVRGGDATPPSQSSVAQNSDTRMSHESETAAPALPKRIHFFVSFSMPMSSLSRSLLEVMELRKQGLDAVLVLRGFVDNNIKATIAAYGKLIKEADVAGMDLPINIDPPLFEKYSVNAVPVMIAEYDSGTGRITGDIGIPYSLSRLEREMGDHGKIGHTYPINEESLLDVIARKQPLIEQRLRQRIETLKKEMYVLKKHDGRYQKAAEDRVYHIDPTWEAPEDILDHEGNVVVAKGSRYNPAEYVQLGSHIIIDGNDPAQVRMALSGGYRTMMIISGDLSKLITKHRKRFWFAPDEVLDKFRIRRVPAIIEQEGKLVRITEKKPD